MAAHLYTSDTLPDFLAAVDLGSNSFHMIVVKIENDQIRVIDRIKEMVRLGEGLTEDKHLRPEVKMRALACLERFGQRLRDMPAGSVRAVGTNTLRQSQDREFIHQAQQALGHPIEVIAGREEARLVYLGVAHGLAVGDEPRLVVDIGGGSTELIIGKGFQPLERESLHMGCVSMSRRFFPDGRITAEALREAEVAASLELRPVRARYQHSHWQLAVGSSGTIKAIREVVLSAGWSQSGITLESLEQLKQALIKAGSVTNLDLKGLSEQRKPVFAGGVAVLHAVFTNTGTQQMLVSNEALREGLLYEMLGRIHQEDVRQRTVQSLARRYSVDHKQARRIENTALALFEQISVAWLLNDPEHPLMLAWAAQLHEIGLTVAHNQFHKHGAYLLENADMSGFSRQEQAVLAALVRGHRRKVPLTDFEALPEKVVHSSIRLCILLRLAILLHRSRSASLKPSIKIDVIGKKIHLQFSPRWLARHPLTQEELKQEQFYLKDIGYSLEFR